MSLRRRSQIEEISAASMSDLAFLLLVFFMVASVFYVKEGLLTTLPKKDSQPKIELRKNVYYLKISGDEVIFTNSEMGNKRFNSIKEFEEQIEEIEIPDIQSKYLVFTATRTNVQNVVETLSIAKKRGFKNISIQKQQN